MVCVCTVSGTACKDDDVDELAGWRCGETEGIERSIRLPLSAPRETPCHDVYVTLTCIYAMASDCLCVSCLIIFDEVDRIEVIGQVRAD